jgi:uncharacterized membrane protein YidH (DUF202 family)
MSGRVGTGLIGFGIVVAAVGAILKYAVTTTTTGFSITEIGLILLIVGIVTAIIGVISLMLSGRHHTTVVETVENSPTGTSRSVDSKDSLG